MRREPTPRSRCLVNPAGRVHQNTGSPAVESPTGSAGPLNQVGTFSAVVAGLAGSRVPLSDRIAELQAAGTEPCLYLPVWGRGGNGFSRSARRVQAALVVVVFHVEQHQHGVPAPNSSKTGDKSRTRWHRHTSVLEPEPPRRVKGPAARGPGRIGNGVGAYAIVGCRSRILGSKCIAFHRVRRVGEKRLRVPVPDACR